MIKLVFSESGPNKSRLCSKLLNSEKIGVPKGITTLNCVLEGKPVRLENQIRSNLSKLNQSTVPIRSFWKDLSSQVSSVVFHDSCKFYPSFSAQSNASISHHITISSRSRRGHVIDDGTDQAGQKGASAVPRTLLKSMVRGRETQARLADQTAQRAACGVGGI